MGKTDIYTKEYMSNPRIFADAFNYYFFHGKQIVKPEELTIQDITELLLPFGKDATYLLLGIEKIDKIKPVFTLVIYWGAKKWDASKSLYEMLDMSENMDAIIKKYINDYKIHIIVPNEIKDFEQFSTELGYCFRYIQSSTQKENSINMCKAIEEMIEEANENLATETARNFFMNGASLELVTKSLPTLSEDEIIAIYKEVYDSKSIY